MAKPPKVVIDETTTKQVAAASILGGTILGISEQLGITRHQVRAIMNSPEFKEIVKTTGDEALQTAKQIIRFKTSEMAGEVTRVLMEQLKENNLEAVKVAIKIIGLDTEEKHQGDTQINVVLPGVKQETVVPATYVVKDEQ